ncbi:hypothetical protein PQX77_002023 [Marasmius sp. AFHP31]|nr:hypothetical protein PQX77_002023 [Marasmius sp. AFHP31]
MIQWATVILWITTIAEVLGNLGDFAWPLVGFRMTSKLLSLRAEPATPLLPTHSQSSSTDSSDTASSQEGLMDRCSEALNKILETLDLVSSRGPMDDIDQVDEFKTLVGQQGSLDELISNWRDEYLEKGSESLEVGFDALAKDVERLELRVNLFTKRLRRANMIRSVGCNSLREVEEGSANDSISVSWSGRTRAEERQGEMSRQEMTVVDEDILFQQATVEDSRVAAERIQGQWHPPMALTSEDDGKECALWGDADFEPR